MPDDGAPFEVDPVEHAENFADAASGDVPETAVRATLAGAAAAAGRNAARLGESARQLDDVVGSQASAHAEVCESVISARRQAKAAAKWYADYYDALQAIATERVDSDA